MSDHGPPTITPGRAWSAVILGGIVTALVVLAAMTVVFAPQPASTPDAASLTRPVPAAPPPPEPVAQPEIAPGTPRPASCDDIYSPQMLDAFGDLVLNPDWTNDPSADVQAGADDPDLLAIIDTNDRLTCRWVSPTGPSGAGVSTNVVWVTPEQAVTVTERLAELGMDCYEELGGLRCIVQDTADDNTFGQSHFVRGGIWLATQWVNAGPNGYTHDMVNTIWAGE
ncbi:hypothetical protein K2F54_17620 [Cryobacterium sp. 1639]|uniref:hypothetical protein n=1 Tax=Cryobacterium inferilacus TaxID=2866629 RepID=UPI001C73C5AA|nr:hypothetical protein [Cryobacterium sp. 1639]MBX0301786.1 hypothetical protein [Cryobacterium sp. 1639]